MCVSPDNLCTSMSWTALSTSSSLKVQIDHGGSGPMSSCCNKALLVLVSFVAAPFPLFLALIFICVYCVDFTYIYEIFIYVVCSV